MRPLPAPENRCEPIRGLKGWGGVGREDAPIPTTFVTFMHDRAADDPVEKLGGNLAAWWLRARPAAPSSETARAGGMTHGRRASPRSRRAWRRARVRIAP